MGKWAAETPDPLARREMTEKKEELQRDAGRAFGRLEAGIGKKAWCLLAYYNRAGGREGNLAAEVSEDAGGIRVKNVAAPQHGWISGSAGT